MDNIIIDITVMALRELNGGNCSKLLFVRSAKVSSRRSRHLWIIRFDWTFRHVSVLLTKSCKCGTLGHQLSWPMPQLHVLFFCVIVLSSILIIFFLFFIARLRSIAPCGMNKVLPIHNRK